MPKIESRVFLESTIDEWFHSQAAKAGMKKAKYIAQVLSQWQQTQCGGASVAPELHPPAEWLTAELSDIKARLAVLETLDSALDSAMDSAMDSTLDSAMDSTLDSTIPIELTRDELVTRLANGDKIAAKTLPANLHRWGGADMKAEKIISCTSKADPDGLAWLPTDKSRAIWVQADNSHSV
jgi:hypothetical protein